MLTVDSPILQATETAILAGTKSCLTCMRYRLRSRSTAIYCEARSAVACVPTSTWDDKSTATAKERARKCQHYVTEEA